jgi:acyl-CoA hydrolase
MEVHIVVHAEDIPTRSKFKCNEAFYTFVAVDQNGSPIYVPEIRPQSEEEKALFEGALRRRQVRLIMAGKMKASDAKELQAYLVDANERALS